MSTAMKVTIKPLQQSDKSAWLNLWHSYHAYHDIKIADDITENAWQKLMTHNHVHGFGAFLEDGQNEAMHETALVGFAHTVVHTKIWRQTNRLYLEDLCVAESVRGNGIGKQLIIHLHHFARLQGYNRLYWTTDKTNKPAQALYNQVAKLSNKLHYQIDISS